MVEELSEAMPEDVRRAFGNALRLFSRWTPEPDAPAPTLPFRSMIISLSGVCDLVLAYKNEPLPVDIHDELWRLIDSSHTKLKADLAIDPSYAAGARCLDTLVQDRRAGIDVSCAPVIEEKPSLET